MTEPRQDTTAPSHDKHRRITSSIMALRCVLLLACTAGAFAGPVINRDLESSSTCANTCPESSKFSFETGKTYEYQYESDVKTHIAGASEEHSSLHVRATALIEVLAPCEMALRLSDVSLQDSTPSQYESRQHVDQSWDFKKALQERSMRFAFIDGKVESVCAEQGDETWVLNIKKGIVSAFQNTQTSLNAKKVTVESDVAGECPVEYEVEGTSWGTTTIKKTKDLLGCTERVAIQSAFQATPYRVESAIQSLPLMKSTHECTQKIKDGILRESACTELHVFRPFSRHNSGAVTEVTYKLTFDRENNGVSTQQGTVSKRSSLLFEHELNTEEPLQSLREVEQTMEKLCRKSENDIAPEVPRLYMQLVRQMRRLDTRSLSDFYRSAGSCTKASTFINNAIPLLGSAASVSIIRDEILGGQLDASRADMWLTSMAFIAEPTKEILREIKPLLASPENIRKSVLSISTLVHSYCRSNPNCQYENEVSDIIRILEDNLHYNCKAEVEGQHDTILMSLKGLGNTGHATQAVPTLNRCFMNTELPVEVRVAALQAFRRMSCEADMTEAINLLSNSLEDSEIRVHAYLAVMKCPSPAILDRVQQILANEEVNQVGSFIWTHLTNLMETANPHKQSIRNILENEILKKNFDMDKRKFSRNMEWSMFSQLINTGAMAESNLIWSQNSFIPRSASMNVTVDMFGQSVNLLELGGRVQGLEQTIEKLLAKHDNTVDASVNSLSDIDRSYDLKRDDPQASYFIRVFGNEIRYDDIHNFDLSSMQDKLNYLDWLIELSKEHKFELTKNQMLLDATMEIPTAAGLPLKLTVDAASSMNINVNGKLDIRQMFAAPSTFDIDGSVKPSAATEINGEMGVDAHVARTGLKMQTTLSSSTVMEGKIQLKDGKIFNLDIKAPHDNTEILSANNKFFIVYREEEREQEMIADARFEKNECTSAKFGQITGLELCGQLSLPTAYKKENVPWFPLWGPANAKIVLNKKDSHDNYVMELKYVKEKTRNNGVTAITDIGRFHFNTPGSSLNRELLVEFRLDRAGRQLTFNLDSPWKKATLEAGLTNTDELKRAFATATLDNNLEYSINAEVQIDEKSYRVDYTPKFELSIPGMQKIQFGGDIKHRPGKKGVFTLALKNVFSEPMKASGSILAINERNQIRYETDIDFTSHLINGKLATFVDRTKDQSNTVSSKFDLEYTYLEQPQQSIHFDKTLVYSIADKDVNVNLEGTWSTTLIDNYNADLHFVYGTDGRRSTVNLNTGFDALRRIIYDETYTMQFDSVHKLDVDMHFKFPYKNIDYSGTANYLYTDNELTYKGLGKYGEDKQVDMEVTLTGMTSKPLNIVTEAKLSYPGRQMSILNTVEERAVKEFHQNLNIELAKYQNIQVNSVYKMGPRHEITSTIAIPDVPQISLKGHLKPVLKNVEAHAEVTYGSKTYLADTNWNQRGNVMNFNTEADIEISCPERTVSARGTARRENNDVTTTLETKWDASRDENKKFVLSSTVNIVPTTPAVNLEINVYPNHFINMNANGKYATTGWYKSSSDVEGSLTFRSSFKNLEDISASFTHDRTPKAYKNIAEVSWKANKKITAKLNLKNKDGWSNVQTDLSLTTPFNGVRTVSGNMNYVLGATTFGSDVKARWENQQITLDVNGEADIPRRSLNGAVTFTSPFENIESLSARIGHTDDGQTIQSSMSTSWSENKNIVIESNVQYVVSSAAATVNGETSISTPFDGFKQGKVMWQHQHDTQKVKNVVQLEHEGISMYNHNLDANYRITQKKTDIDIRASMKAHTLDAINVVLEHSRSYKKSDKTEISVEWAPMQIITYSHDMKRDATTLFSSNMKFTSPFEGFENIILNTNTHDERGRILSSNEIKWGNNQKITLESEMTLNGYELEQQIRFRSPFNGAENIVLDLSNQQQDNIWVSRVEANYGQKIEVSTQLGMGFRKVLALSVKSPYRYMNNLMFNSAMTGGLRNFRYNIDLNHEELTNPIALSGISNTADVNDIKITLDLVTPFEDIRSLKAELNHKIEGDNIHCDGTIEHPSYKGSVTQDVTYSTGRSLTTSTVIEYIEGQKIEFTSALQMKPSVAGTLTWKSPFEKLEDISLTFDHEGTMNAFVSKGELVYSPSDKITADVKFNLRGNNFGGTAKVTTPFTDARRVSLTVNHEGPATAFKNDATFELNEMTVSGRNEFNLRDTSLTIKSELQTPIEGYETMTVEVNHNGPVVNFNNNILLTMGNKQMSGTSELRLRQSSLNANLVLNMPFESFKSLNIDLDHRGTWTNFNNKLVVMYNTQKIVGKGRFALSGNNLNGKLVVKTPFSEAGSIVMEVTHEGPLAAFKNNAALTINNKGMTASSEFNLNGNNVDLKADVKLPLKKVKALSVVLRHEGPATNFNNDVVLTYNKKQITARSQFSLSGTDLVTKASLECPDGTTSAEITHSGPITNFNNNAILKYNDKEILGSSEMQINGNNLHVKADFACPAKNMGFEVTHSGPATQFKNDFTISYNGQQARGSSECSLNGNTLNVKGTFACPGATMSAEINHNGPANNFRNDFSLIYEGSEVTGSSEFSLSGNTMKMKAAFACPSTTASAEINHSGPANNFNNNFVLKYKDQESSGATTFSLNGNRVKLTVQFVCPRCTIDIDVNHRGPATNFKNDLAVVYQGKRATGSSEFSLNGNTMQLKAQLVCPGSTMNAEINHRGPPANFNNDISLKYQDKEVTGSSEFLLNGNDVKAKANFAYPGSSVSAAISHSGVASNFNNDLSVKYNNKEITGSSEFLLGENTLTAKAAFSCPCKTISADVSHSGPLTNFNNNMNMNIDGMPISASTEFSHSGNRFNGKASFGIPDSTMSAEFNHRGKRTNFSNGVTLIYNEYTVTGNSKFRLMGNGITAEGALNLPTKSMSFDVSHQGPISDFKNSLTIVYGKKQIRGTSEFSAAASAIAGKASLSLPCEHLKSLALEVNHNGTPHEFTNNVLFAWNDQEISGSSQFRLSGSTLETSGTLNIPDARMSAELKHNGESDNFRNNIILAYNNKQITGNSEFLLRGNAVTAKGNLNIPSYVVSVEMNHDGGLYDFNNHGVITYNGQQMDGSSMFKFEDTSLAAKATLNIPDNSMAVEINHNGPKENFASDIVAVYADKRIAGSMQFNHQGNTMNGKTTLSLPLETLKSLSIEVNHNGPADNFKNDFSIKYDNKDISGKTQFKLRNTRLNAMAELRIPVQELPVLSVEITHTGPLTSFRNNGVIIIGNENIKANSEFSIRDTALNGKFNLRTTYGMEPFAVEFDHTGPWTGFNNKGVVKYGNHAMSGGSEFSLVGTNLEAKMNMDCTFEMKPVSLTISHAGPAENFRNSLIFVYGTDQISGNSEYRIQGTSLTAKVNMDTTFGQVKPIAVEIVHNGPATSFSNTGLVSYGRKNVQGSSEFLLLGNKMNAKANMQTTFGSVEPVSFDITHEGIATNFNTDAVFRYGSYHITTSKEFRLNGNTMHVKSTMDTNIGDVKPSSIEINHEGPITGFNNNLSAAYGDDTVSGTTEFSLGETSMHLKATADSSVRAIKPMSIEITHNGPLEKFDNVLKMTYGNKEISSNAEFSIDGNTITGAVKMQTPFKQVEKLMAKFTHNGKNFRNFENSGTLKLNNDKYTGQSEFRWFGKIFKLSAEVNVPEEYSMKINHKGVSDNFSNTLKIKYPGEKLSGTSSFKITKPAKLEGRVNIETTLKSLKKLTVSVEHEGDPSNFRSAVDVKTSIKGYKTLAASINHQGNSANFNSGISSMLNDKTVTGSLNYKKTDSKLQADATLTTPFEKFENFGASIDHEGGARDFQSTGTVTSSIPGYERFSGSLKHKGDINNLKTTGELSTPIPNYTNFKFDVEHEGNVNAFKTSGALTTSIPDYERFGANVEHTFDGRTLHTAGSVQTPYAGYEEFGMSVDHTGTPQKFETTAGITTPMRKYRNFGLSINHNGNSNQFRTSAEATSSVRGYERFAGTVEKSGTLKDFETSVQVQTPFQRYESIGVSVKHTGDVSSFRSNGEITTSVPGYDKFAASLNHNGNLNSFTTTGEVQTPFEGHETYVARMSHDSETNVQTTASFEYPGKKYDFNLNHQGNAENFNTEMSLTTPHVGYESFGLTMNHNGNLNDFTESGIIRLPFRELPEIIYSASHRGNLNEFTGSGSVEYQGQKVESNFNFKKTSSWNEEGYTAGLTVTTTYSQIRDIRVTATHTRKDNKKIGALDVTHNGKKTVDLDYDYTTNGPTSINVNVRQPRSLETTINFNGNGEQLHGDALIKWKQTTINGQIDIKNLENDRELSFQATLPTRTVALTTGYTKTATAVTHKTDLQWDNAEEKKLSYAIEITKTERRNQKVVDGKFNIKSSKINGEMTVSHVCIPGRQYTTEVTLQTTSRMSIKSELNIDEPRFNHKITVEHPELRKGASINIEGEITDKIQDGKIELQYNRETFTLTGRAADESTYAGMKCVHSFGLAHPNSKLDFQYTSTYEDSAEERSLNMEAKYLMSSDQQYKTASLRTAINKLRNEFDLEWVMPVDTIRLSGRQVAASNGMYQYTGEASCDHMTVRGELSLTKGRSADLVLHAPNNLIIEAKASRSAEELVAEVSHSTNGAKINDIKLKLSKDNDRMLTAKRYIRPNMMQDIQEAWSSTSLCQSLRTAAGQLEDAVREEVNTKIRYIKVNAKPFYKAVVSIKKDVVSTYSEVKKELIQMYNNNEFHVKDIYEWCVNTIEITRSKYITLRRQARDNYTKAQAVVQQSGSTLQDMSDRAWVYTQNLGEQISTWWQDLPEWSDITENVQGNARELAERIRSSPTLQKVIERIQSSEMFETVESWSAQTGSGDAAATSASVESMWTSIMQRDDIKAGLEYIKDKAKDNQFVAQYLEIKKNIDEVMKDIHEHGLKTIRTNLVAWLKELLQTGKDSFTSSNGDIEFTVYIPLPLDDIQSIPKVDINLSKYITNAKQMYNYYMPKYDWTFWDYYYNYKPSSNYQDMIPPFKAHATVSGNQHYMTFDKKFFEFAGECSYLLARDFIDGSFSVIANYERVDGRPSKKSVTVHSNSKTIEIFPEGHVILDNSRVEMPVVLDKTSIVRDQSMIRVQNSNGINVLCDLHHDRCTVEVTGWYFGKTAGLLGTYNYEPVDDLTTIDHRRVENVGEFASSWAVGQRCRPTNGAIDVSNEVLPETRRYELCAKYFEEESSPFRRCFKVVDPSPFMRMCMNDMPSAINRLETEEDTCDVSAFYVSECQKYDVPISIPNLCVRCETENGQTYSEGQNVTITGEDVPNSADIVFVIHQSDCNRMMIDNLKSMVDSMEKVFKTENLRNNRYSLVGYGGVGIETEPHVHTMNGQIFETRDKILLGLENFNTQSGASEDAMAAVKYAAHLPFRAGVSKNIILLPCSGCRQAGATFSELQQLLLFRDINFHVMMQYEFLFKGNRNAGTAYIFGVDRETVYTRKDAGTTELTGDPDLRSQILMPKDLCVALSEETDGSVFNTLQYINSRPFIQKRFVDVLVRVIADKAEPSECQICDCVPDNVGAGKPVCRSCVRPNPIYDLMPNYPILPPVQNSRAPVIPSKPKVKKPKTKKTKAQINANKRAMRARRLLRQQQQQS